MNPQDSAVINDRPSSGGSQPLAENQQDIDLPHLDTDSESNVVQQTSYLPQKEVPVESDTLELAWVDKVKAIIQNFSDDPHKMTKELETVRIDFMQKQYGKTIKSNDDREV